MLASGVARCARTSIPRTLAAVCVLARYIAISAFWRVSPVIVNFWTAFNEHLFRPRISQTWGLSL